MEKQQVQTTLFSGALSKEEGKVKKEAKQKEVVLPTTTISELDKLKEEVKYWKYKYDELSNSPIPDYNLLMQFSIQHASTDIECDQFFLHGSTSKMFNQTYGQPRGGGGWSGAIKSTINILNKMRNKGLIK